MWKITIDTNETVQHRHRLRDIRRTPIAVKEIPIHLTTAQPKPSTTPSTHPTPPLAKLTHYPSPSARNKTPTPPSPS